jgi:L-aspartate oxidase
MGGVRADVHGRTSLKGLYAAGEVACTGVHGANRLASNSLLEGLVFGARAAEAMSGEAPPANMKSPEPFPQSVETGDGERLRKNLQQSMWQKAGLLRDAAGLEAGLAEVHDPGRELPRQFSRALLELRNLQVVGELIFRSALAREESRGAHYRNDFPQRDDVRYSRHSVIRQNQITFEEF